MSELLQTERALPVDAGGPRSTGWWGLWALVVTEASLFGYLLLIYFYEWLQNSTPWPPDGPPALTTAGINTLILLSSSGCVWWAENCVKHNRKRLGLVPMIASVMLGAAFVAVQLKEWHSQPFSASSHLYGSLFFTITGFHMLHVVVGLIMLIMVWVWTVMGYFGPARRTPIKLAAIYWHFVDAVWLVVFASLYLLPRAAG